MAALLVDDYVDVDALVAKYHRRKSTVLFLIAAIGFIVFGTLSGYAALQYSNARLESAKTTVTEFAQITAASPQCQATPTDPVCEKARRVIDNPEIAITGGSYSPEFEIPIQIAKASYAFSNDPYANIIAAILTQPIILRIQ